MESLEKTSTGGQGEDFPSTNWCRLAQLKQADQKICRELINHLVGRYWKPVYCFLRKKGFSNHAAKDLTQDFFCEVVLEKKLFQKADKDKGRLRTFLLACLNHYTANYARKGKSLKNRHDQRFVQLDALEDPSNLLISTEISPDQAYQISWVRQLLQESIATVQHHCLQNDQIVHWQLFKSWFLSPIMDDSPRPSMKSLCEQYGLKNQKQAANMLITVQRYFRRVFYEKLAVSLENPSDIEKELKDIFNFFE